MTWSSSAVAAASEMPEISGDGLRKAYYIDRNPNGGLDQLTHAKQLLSQVTNFVTYLSK